MNAKRQRHALKLPKRLAVRATQGTPVRRTQRRSDRQHWIRELSWCVEHPENLGRDLREQMRGAVAALLWVDGEYEAPFPQPPVIGDEDEPVTIMQRMARLQKRISSGAREYEKGQDGGGDHG